MRLTPFSVPLILFFSALAGCDPEGTCISKNPKKEEDRGSCTVNVPKSQCEAYYGTKIGTEGKEFLDETKEAGIRACKNKGFTEPVGQSEAEAKAGELGSFTEPYKAK